MTGRIKLVKDVAPWRARTKPSLLPFAARWVRLSHGGGQLRVWRCGHTLTARDLVFSITFAGARPPAFLQLALPLTTRLRIEFA